MNRIPSFFLLLFLSVFYSETSSAQISSSLQTAMQQEPNAFHRIRIEFEANVDCYALNQLFKQEGLSVEERPKIVISQLQEQAEVSQRDILAKLRSEFYSSTKNIQAFWIVNLIVLEAKTEAIIALKEMDGVALIDLENSTILPHDPIIRSEGQPSRSVGGIEPGLAAINAPAMWALGYTGRGRIIYDYDTGVWPTHPAFSERFLANRYPLDQCWYGYFSNTPNGNVSDHGTHTLGTMAGLIEDTQDTIGVAFGSYWIANDFVTSTVEALPPLTDMIGAFEWALNPDGDINTTDDIPDVINNSWRWRDDPDTVQCGGFVVNLMNAIEAAGIANVFSGGNSGPNNTTVNAPQRINTSEVNTFSVGSVNGNSSFPYPISNFSTVGPTQCPGGGNSSLEIHPEVVAPGQNVRSAWGTDGFNTISGTSMAAPHVSGAILLLKEAFPYLSGEDLLWSLYLTAVDLGDVGEDNVYGMGIIDVYAAFQYLSQTNTPVDPNAVAWDVSIKVLTDPNNPGFICDNAVHPTTIITNLGDSTISSVEFEYSINGGTIQNHSWSGNLLPGNSATVVIPSISTSEYGDLAMDLVVSIPGHANEYDLYNNHWRYIFNRREPVNLPFIDGFEEGFEPKNWFISNDDSEITWDTVLTSGLNWSSHSAAVQCYSYSPRLNQKDGLISNTLIIPPTSDNVRLIFDVAYQKRSTSGTIHDTLKILVSTDCGVSFPTTVYTKASDDLSTKEGNGINFAPESESDWRKDSVSLSAYAGQDILLKFETTNRNGNNIYIDNVKVFVGDQEPMGLSENAEEELKIYPNPSSRVLYIESENTFAPNSTIQVYNTIGSAVEVKAQVNGTRILLETAALQNGVYFITIVSNEKEYHLQFMKQY